MLHQVFSADIAVQQLPGVGLHALLCARLLKDSIEAIYCVLIGAILGSFSMT